MSTDCYCSLAVGFSFDCDTIHKVFRKRIEEKSHMEPRFDPKTGFPVQSVKVIDQEESFVYKLGNKTYREDETLDFIDDFSNLCKCNVFVCSQFGVSESYVFSPKIPKDQETGSELDTSHVSIGRGLKLSYINSPSFTHKLAMIRATLESFGIKKKDWTPEIRIVYNVG